MTKLTCSGLSKVAALRSKVSSEAVADGFLCKKTRGAGATEVGDDYPIASRHEQRRDIDVGVNVMRASPAKEWPLDRRPAQLQHIPH
jgi:hypothetical protein